MPWMTTEDKAYNKSREPPILSDLTISKNSHLINLQNYHYYHHHYHHYHYHHYNYY